MSGRYVSCAGCGCNEDIDSYALRDWAEVEVAGDNYIVVCWDCLSAKERNEIEQVRLRPALS